MPKTYIAGPMRGIRLFNFPAFDAARDALLKAGHEVVSPADIDRSNGFDPKDLPADYDWNVISQQSGTLQEIIARDHAAVMECDTIYLLPGWERSQGALSEYHLAKWAGKVVLFALNANPSAESQRTVNPKDAIGATKPPQHCVPLPVLYEVGMGMFEGGWKYRDHNYRMIGVQASAYYDATRRHLDAWWEGEDIDPKSGIHHVTKAISGLFVLRDCMMQSAAGAPVEFQDDRPPKSHVKMEDLERQFLVMLERLKREHGDCKPPYTAQG